MALVNIFRDWANCGTPKEGQLYFVQSGSDGPIKIGFTRNDVGNRLRILQTGNPERLRILYHTDGTINEEKTLHKKFNDYRIRGEWFFPHKSIIDFIKICKGADTGKRRKDNAA